ncbi:hypothetical protein BAE44_0009443 [Dichanthelium oligosanthes]|uniref:F-box domain-containing protein n=1 Tax=Dichanthelium oligosanthes TaxID=888268 RepID=A0A1E5VWR1_9POAL|nr:hypothetical protein BAE44_0009443 [Dichanthelium oligosanthes]
MALPDDAVAEVLSRLPPRSIARCRAVCRAWNALASNPSVDRALAERRPAVVTTILKDCDRWQDLDDDRPDDVVRIEHFRGRWHPDIHNTEPCPQALSLDDMTVSTAAFRSWDGVLCTRVFPRKPRPGAATDYCMLWNPLTDACAVVSAPSAADQGRIIGGYAHPVTGRFHLLHSTDVTVSGDRDLMAPITVRILRVGDDDTGWREVSLPKSKTISMKGEWHRSVSLHGNLQWLVQPADSGKVKLLVFGTVREEFRFMAAAPEHPGAGPNDGTVARCAGRQALHPGPHPAAARGPGVMGAG